MAAGEFLKGLSEGIFERLGELRKEQDAQDELQRKNSIAVLSKAYESAEPGGQQEILRLMGDVIGANKGKMKGFWNAFSGMPDRSVEDQLGTTMRQFSQKLVSPEVASKARAGGDLARLFQPQTPEQQTNQANRLQAEKDLQGKIVFKDPFEQQLRFIKARGEVAEQVQADRAALQAYYQGVNREDSQRHQEEMKALTESLRSKRKLRDEAEQVAGLQGRMEVTSQDWEQAAVNLHRRGELNEDALQELINFRRAATAEKKNNVKSGKSQIPLERLNIARRGEANTIQKSHTEAMSKVAKAQSDMDSLVTQINSMTQKYAGGATFNPDKKMFEGGNVANANLLAGDLLKEFRTKQAEKEQAQKEAQGFYNQASRKEYSQFLKRGKTFNEPLEIANPEAVTPAVPPTRGSLNNVGIGSQRPRRTAGNRPAPALGPFDRIMRIDPNTVQEGQIIPMNDGKKWKVTGKGKDHIRLTPYLGQ